jgi:hypothetical protein
MTAVFYISVVTIFINIGGFFIQWRDKKKGRTITIVQIIILILLNNILKKPKLLILDIRTKMTMTV